MNEKVKMVLTSNGAHAAEKDKKMRAQRVRTKSAFLIDNKGNILSVVLLILLGFAILSVLRGKPVIDFSGFLSVLKNAPTVSLDWLNLSQLSLGDWGLLNGLRDFIAMFLGVFDVLAFIGTALLQVILYVLYFLKVLLL